MDDQEANLMLARVEEQFDLELDDLLNLDKENLAIIIVEFFDELGERKERVLEPSQNMIDRLFEIKEDIRDALE